MDLDALRVALAASPENIPLLLMVAKLEEDRFAIGEARELLDRVLALDAGNRDALLGIARLLDFSGESSQAIVRLEDLCIRHPGFAAAWLLRARLSQEEGEPSKARQYYDRAVELDRSQADDSLLEEILRAGGTRRGVMTSNGDIRDAEDDDDAAFEGLDAAAALDLGIDFKVKSDLKFSDVGGMEQVKDDIRMKIIHPLKNPDLFAAYGKKAGGGVLLYGPPGCGKTLMAQATAGEIDATFLAVGLHQILDMYMGESEQKLHKIFELARKSRPSVLFFDETDALAADRRDMRQSAGRTLVNQFLSELDGAQAQNDDLLILGATNAPWQLDSAFLRPGRFDRIIFVPPPDRAAREEIAKIHAKGKPLADFDPADVAKRTEGFSGADLKAVFDQATEAALTEAMRKGNMVPVTGKMLANAAKNVKPSTKKWFESAKNHALYANQSGFYDDILTYMGLKK
ncbi:AAA family ATPase [Luteolibacter yonseiensis]|uniref:AAA family ATPase n=1 Tax=Luteolibacter yonseiensis TaxID=1144680 RepID=A0A934R138_9BACT|nr:ATP-binding protein [Luteolibacter yonseiensis]MBK1814228.1 AAA family ATPase [Luteolibacter yonseiensis]